MHISQVRLVGFRNFKNATINFCEKTLIIGPNEVGKTNLIAALRLLLDKRLSLSDIEPLDTDFNVESNTGKLSIHIFFSNAVEDCILATFPGKISDDGNMVLAYTAIREASGKKTFEIRCGKDEAALAADSSVLNGRFYLKHLNIDFVRSNRDLEGYLRNEKKRLFDEFRQSRTEDEEKGDAKTIKDIETNLHMVNELVSNLSFIKKSESHINGELSKLVPQNDDTKLGFDIGALDPEEYVGRVSLVAKTGAKPVEVGGDGRSNQIFLSMWSAQKDKVDVEECTIHCIEEPEAHLHPHNQRNLAAYLYGTISGQIITTTHSPQIACEFSPNSIIKLLKESARSSKAASEGCSEIVESTFENFSYRLNILPAEAFFASSVLLVEGPSEVLFYKALSIALGIELDKLNISILSVNGVDFEPFVKIFSSLEIPFVIRTDNDVVKTRAKKYYFSGIKRCWSLANSIYETDKAIFMVRLCAQRFDSLESRSDYDDDVKKASAELRKYDIFLAGKDLESDLIESNLFDSLSTFYGVTDVDDLYKKMTKRKGMNIYDYLLSEHESLTKLKDDPIAEPLIRCQKRAFGK